ncbi:PAS domain S-box protein [Maribacter confluentis]|uniref:histidine kinase n=1 Tax=Maribacter confluentis TaxID=1656093 RepID=A0ABT8RNX0_9FLAO|nr:PAS domain S-box protein [Maribacter confluentis]MDO1512605.1 PAS domain S-box protein [Maribacter confluentis]
MKRDKIADKERLEALGSYTIMDSEEESLYNDVTALAAAICNTPISLISLVDDNRQFFKSHHGLDLSSTTLDDSFCKYLILDDLDVLIVEDPNQDKRFSEYASVKGDLKIGFYAGVSLTNDDGYQLGSLCVMDQKSKQLNELQINGLKTLAKQIIQLFELRKSKKISRHQKNKLEQKGILLDNIVSATGIGIWERDIKINLMKLNYECLKILGYSAEAKKTLQYSDWENFIHPEDLKLVRAKLERCFEQKTEIYDIKYRIINLRGETNWVHDNGKILSWDNDQPLLMYGTIQNITQKVNDDFELVKLKNNQEAIINNTKDLLWSVDTEYRLIMANNAYHELIRDNIGYQFNVGDVVFSENFDDDINNKWRNNYARALNGEQFSIKGKFYNPVKLRTTYGLTSFNPLYDNNGKLLGLTCYSKDITSEVLSQQVLISAKEEMQKILDASLDIICTIDEEGYFLSINKACQKIWGYEPKDLIGKQYLEFVHEKDKKLSSNEASAILEGEKVTGFENRYIHKNNTIVPMLWSANWDEKERVVYCIGRDITEKKKADVQLEQSERRFKSLVQDGSDLIAILNTEANFLYVSPTSTRILKTTPKEYLGTNAFDYVHPEDYDEVLKQFYEILEVPQTKIRPFRFRMKNHQYIWMETTVTNKLDEPSINGIVVNSRDVSNRINYLKAIEKQNAKLKEIAWTQSHELRAPVARLMGLVNLIRDENHDLDSEEKNRMLQYIIDSADEIDVVIKKIVDSTVQRMNIEEIE